jgi:hypothetical protein
MLTAVEFIPPQGERFFVNAAGNVYFEKSVKYNFETGINDKSAEPAGSLEPPL